MCIRDRNIAIIGAGAYASYAASVIYDVHPEWNVHIFEVGDKKIKTQDEDVYKRQR